MRAGSGFSLIELVTVLLIVAALAVFAAPRLNISGFSQYSFHQELMAAMRHAQKTANASGESICVIVRSDGSYSVGYSDGSSPCVIGTPLAKPGGSGNLTGNAPDGVAITSGAHFTFNGFGEPGGRQTISLDGGARRVVVEANTGYVHD